MLDFTALSECPCSQGVMSPPLRHVCALPSQKGQQEEEAGIDAGREMDGITLLRCEVMNAQ